MDPYSYSQGKDRISPPLRFFRKVQIRLPGLPLCPMLFDELLPVLPSVWPVPGLRESPQVSRAPECCATPGAQVQCLASAGSSASSIRSDAKLQDGQHLCCCWLRCWPSSGMRCPALRQRARSADRWGGAVHASFQDCCCIFEVFYRPWSIDVQSEACDDTSLWCVCSPWCNAGARS